MKKKLLAVLLLTMVLSMYGCTEQMAVKDMGGSMILELEPNQKLEEITWKEDQLWYLTRPMRDDEEPETHTFEEKSEFGYWEGTVTIIESRGK